jgi:hypothetical protein
VPIEVDKKMKLKKPQEWGFFVSELIFSLKVWYKYGDFNDTHGSSHHAGSPKKGCVMGSVEA